MRHRKKLRQRLALGEPREAIAERLSGIEEAFVARMKELEPYLSFRPGLTGRPNHPERAATKRCLEAWSDLSTEDQLLALRLLMNSTTSDGGAGARLLERDQEAAKFAEELRQEVAAEGGDALDIDVWWETDETGFELCHRGVGTTLGFELRMSRARDAIEVEELEEGLPRWCGPWWFQALGDSRWRTLLERHLMAAKGVYRIIAVDGSGSALPIPRARCVDPTGTLYIGTVEKAGSRLIERLDKARDCFERKTAGGRWSHAGAWNLASYGILDGLDIQHGLRLEGANHLRFAWLSSPGWTHFDTMREEARLLLAYGAVFGDLPPGNMNAGTLKYLGGTRLSVLQEARGRRPDSWYLPAT